MGSEEEESYGTADMGETSGEQSSQGQNRQPYGEESSFDSGTSQGRRSAERESYDSNDYGETSGEQSSVRPSPTAGGQVVASRETGEESYGDDDFGEASGEPSSARPSPTAGDQASASKDEEGEDSYVDDFGETSGERSSARPSPTAGDQASASKDEEEEESYGSDFGETSGERSSARPSPTAGDQASTSRHEEGEEAYGDDDFVETSGTSGDRSSTRPSPTAEDQASASKDEEEEESYGDDFGETSGERSSARPSPTAGDQASASKDEEEEESYGDDDFGETSGETSGERSSARPTPKAVMLPSAALSGEALSVGGDEDGEPSEANASSRATPSTSSADRGAFRPRVSFADDAEVGRHRGGRRPSVDSTPFNGKGRFDGVATMESAFSGATASGDTGSSDDEAEPLVITFIGASGLRNADAGGAEKSDPYCTCEVVGQPGTRIRTQVVDDADDLVWNQSEELRGCFAGDDLLFTIWDQDGDAEDSEVLGRATLRASVLAALGAGGTWRGELELTETGSEQAVLGVKVELPRAGLRTRRAQRSRRPSISFVASFEGDPGVDLATIRPAGQSTPHPRLAPGGSSSFFDMPEEGPGSPSRRRRSVTFDPSSDAQGDADVCEADGRPPSRRNSVRKSIDSTPRYAKDVWGADFPEEAFPMGLDEDDEDEEETGPVVVQEEDTEVIIEDALDVSSGPARVANTDNRLCSPAEEVFMMNGGSTPQGPPGVALRAENSLLASSRSQSSPALSKRRSRRPKAKASPSNAKFDRKAQRWDTRFHLVDETNDLKPKQLRQYFSRPASLPQLREHLAKKGLPEARLDELEEPEVPARRSEAPISADAGPPVIPGRHRIGGRMEQQGRAMPWNNRWHTGVHLYNEGMHPLHRAGFSKPSVFEESNTQTWRRQGHVEVAAGVWSPAPRYISRFPPLGV